MSDIAVPNFHFAQVPVELINNVKKGRALHILNHLLSLCSLKKPEVWIDQGLLGKKMGLHRDTVGRWVRYLERAGYLLCLGFRRDGRRKRYRIIFSTSSAPFNPNKPETQSDSSPTNLIGQSPALASQNLRCDSRHINRIEETNLKKQTVVDVSKIEFSSNAKIALKQKLKAIGVHKHVIERLVSKYPMEKIEDQIEHLQFLMKEGDIAKPAAWLITAVEKQYELPKEIDKKAILEEQKAQALRKASQLAQEAKSELLLDNLENAKELAAKSLLVANNATAKDILNEQNQMLERKEKIEKARLMVSTEEHLLIQQEEEQKKLGEMRRICRKSDVEILSSSFFKIAVAELVNERLLCLV